MTSFTHLHLAISRRRSLPLNGTGEPPGSLTINCVSISIHIISVVQRAPITSVRGAASEAACTRLSPTLRWRNMKQTHGPLHLPLRFIVSTHFGVTASGIDDLGFVQVALPPLAPRLPLLSDTLTKPFDEVPSFHNLNHISLQCICWQTIDLTPSLRSLRLGHNRSNLIGPACIFLLESSANVALLTILATCAHTSCPAVFCRETCYTPAKRLRRNRLGACYREQILSRLCRG